MGTLTNGEDPVEMPRNFGHQNNTIYFGNYSLLPLNIYYYTTDHPYVTVSNLKVLINFVMGHLLPCAILILIMCCCQIIIRWLI